MRALILDIDGTLLDSSDVDNALYMTSMTGAVEKKDQDKLILWGIVAEFLGRAKEILRE